MPLDVDDGIELPQLELIETRHDDCTTVYSTGIFIEFLESLHLASKLHVISSILGLYFNERTIFIISATKPFVTSFPMTIPMATLPEFFMAQWTA